MCVKPQNLKYFQDILGKKVKPKRWLFPVIEE